MANIQLVIRNVVQVFSVATLLNTNYEERGPQNSKDLKRSARYGLSWKPG